MFYYGQRIEVMSSMETNPTASLGTVIACPGRYENEDEDEVRGFEWAKMDDGTVCGFNPLYSEINLVEDERKQEW